MLRTSRRSANILQSAKWTNPEPAGSRGRARVLASVEGGSTAGGTISGWIDGDFFLGIEPSAQASGQGGVALEFFGDEGQDAECLGGDMVFHALDIAINRFLIDPEASQQASQNIMALNDFTSELSSFGGEDETAIAFMDDESFGVQPSKHCGDAGL